jgi:hypothetical protein
MENKAVDMEVKMAGLENKIADLDKTRGAIGTHREDTVSQTL